MIQTATAPVTSYPATTARSKPESDVTLEAAFEHARRVTDMYGIGNIDVALAWETVEELSVAQARKNQVKKQLPSAFARYCSENPEAPECRIYGD